MFRPPSLASQLPQGISVTMNFVNHRRDCGSWLASDGGIKINSCRRISLGQELHAEIQRQHPVQP